MVQGGGPSKKAAVAKLSTGTGEWLTPLSTRPRSRHGSSSWSVLPDCGLLSWLDRDSVGKRSFLKQQEADDLLQQNQHMVELESYHEKNKKRKGRSAAYALQDFTVGSFSVTWLMPEGLVGWAPLLNILNTIIGAASGHPPPPPH